MPAPNRPVRRARALRSPYPTATARCLVGSAGTGRAIRARGRAFVGARGRALVGALVGAALVALTACSAAEPQRQAQPHAGTAGHTTATSRSPAASSRTTRPAATPRVRIAFGGDVHFEGADRVRLANDPRTAIGPMAAVLRGADLAMVNLETAVTQRGTPQPKTFVFRAPPTAFTALRAAGVDVATQANNHGMDFGAVGLRDSIAAAQAAHFPVVGIGTDADAAFAPYVVPVAGERIAILGATQVLDANLIASWTASPGQPGLASAKDEPRLLAAVRAARRVADVVVVYLHYGTELHSCPTSAQTHVAQAVAAAGADIVVGSHAHVLLGGGWLPATGSYVDYGLGNFVFYASSGPTAESGVLTLTLDGRQVTRAEWTPARISGGVPRPLSGAARVAAERDWQRLRGCTGLSAAPS